ncbi:pectinesterase inhibitor 3-like [Chenopodium quinoa]|uniref:Pectinesterase inhibitor domain-containing protein n=1 Tax=Chenopodium quinoa TaxID=63459 RepID=A0A803L8P4_CHEQI|nr:pectinesterase inhibitor 3-like [Chenopodium quinoa]XP_021734148.1 pectinesterase inhibitor 3-like [Chenopodium quinoa]
MARQQFFLVATLLFLCVTGSLASYSPATSYLISTCDDATYSALCLQTLLPDVDRINSTPKKSTRLAIEATIAAAQSGSKSITQISKQPQVWTREANSLNDCSTSIANTVKGLNAAMDTTDHLGGGSKSDKESKRTSMINNIRPVFTAINTCLNNLQGLRARDVVLQRVQESTTPLNHLATNAIDLIRRMQF